MSMNYPLSFVAAKRIAYDEYASSPDVVASYLVHCTSERDMYHTFRQLRRNCPELFVPEKR